VAPRLANDGQFQTWQKHTEAGIQRAFLRAGNLRTSLVLLPLKLPGRTDCARDLSKKAAREMDATFQKKSLLSDKDSQLPAEGGRQFPRARGIVAAQ
jgi:hypothetical protein